MLIPQEAITKYLGRDAPKWISYPASALGGFVLAVCSCTIMPLFASICKKGAGLGPAITFLFVGPAVNILLSLVFGAGIGLSMARFFRQDDELYHLNILGRLQCSRAFHSALGWRDMETSSTAPHFIEQIRRGVRQRQRWTRLCKRQRWGWSPSS